MIGADEVTVRYLRVRLGDRTDDDTDAVLARYVKNVILDHVSASWSIDETMSVYHADDSVTVQWSLVDETRNGYATYGGTSYKRDRPVADPFRKSGIIDSQADVGGWPELRSTAAPAETDRDGMPDDWEVGMA